MGIIFQMGLAIGMGGCTAAVKQNYSFHHVVYQRPVNFIHLAIVAMDTALGRYAPLLGAIGSDLVALHTNFIVLQHASAVYFDLPSACHPNNIDGVLRLELREFTENQRSWQLNIHASLHDCHGQTLIWQAQSRQTIAKNVMRSDYFNQTYAEANGLGHDGWALFSVLRELVPHLPGPAASDQLIQEKISHDSGS